MQFREFVKSLPGMQFHQIPISAAHKNFAMQCLLQIAFNTFIHTYVPRHGLHPAHAVITVTHLLIYVSISAHLKVGCVVCEDFVVVVVLIVMI